MRRAWVGNRFIQISILLLFLAVVQGGYSTNTSSDFFTFDENKIKIEGNLRPFTPTIQIEEINKSRYMVKMYMHSSSASQPPAFSLKLSIPKDNINQLWNSQTWSNKSFFSLPSYDRAAAEFSIISGLTINDQNQVTFTCRDGYDTRFINTYIQEQGDTMVFCLGFFEDNPPLSAMQKYQVEILLDFRNIHFSQAIHEASRWRLTEEFSHGIKSADSSKVPVYSTWYPMHRNIPLENITRELDSLQNFNFKSILIDDGWRSLVKMKVDTAYSYEEQSLQTMQLFDEKRRNMHMNLYLWYSLPFLGGNPVISQRFEGKYINYKPPKQLHVLDPRYADVRYHLISTYANFYRTWNFDGFWFDFLNNFYTSHTTTVTQDLGRDFVDVSLALERLTDEMDMRLKNANPEVFLGHEFKAVGPNRSDQNLLSGFVGVSSTQIVREKMVNNRLLYGQYTPFVEILGIHPRDKSKDVARKFQSIMFGNPYLSFFNTTMPQDNKQAVRFWLNYWQSNYDVLMTGDFRPIKVSRNYPVIKVENDDKMIYTIYDEYTLNLPLSLEKSLDVINAKESETVNFVSAQPGIIYQYSIHNHLGQSIENGTLKTKKKNAVEFIVPEGGFIHFQPNS